MPLAMVDARVPFVGAVTIVTGDGPREPVSFATMSIVPGPPLGRKTVWGVAHGGAGPAAGQGHGVGGRDRCGGAAHVKERVGGGVEQGGRRVLAGGGGATDA